ncbi:MAG: DEAD/DEAH box helicase [Methanobrevibacter arboriphilus]|uniref:DEAD/DEAH box helicase n=1 Tax=Methanobrevibacter arboriphilus TaxID=39441 RepID=A0A843ACC1_METAZ|nr:DEAD/DEAH box helicase [Methanobrevibacter arboriphilus]MBF4468612.1 DEAD/DEAH box helicase [Methanobrevibacter arboriphilus]
MINKENYLNNKRNQLETILLEDSKLFSFINQLVAKRINVEFNSKYSESYLWRHALFLSSKGSFLLKNNSKDEIGIQSVKTAAEIYENLYYTSKKYEKGYLLILSSLCYDIAGYQANAKCLIDKYHELDSNLENYYSFENHEEDVIGIYENKVLKIIQLFLQQKISMLSAEKGKIEHISETKNINYYYFFEDFLKSMDYLSKFILKGEENNYKEYINKSYENILYSGNVTLSHLLNLFNTRISLFQQRNIWDVLNRYVDTNNIIWNKYIKLLTMDIYGKNGLKPIQERISRFEFWQSQLKAINKGILLDEDSYILQMPTSAGKTFVAETMIINSLVNNPDTKCIYIAPFKSLAFEVYENFSNNLNKLGFNVSKSSGDYEIDEYEFQWMKNADILIATPEKIDLLYRIRPEFFKDISLVVIDEGHIIGNDGLRSSLFELLITKLKIKFRKNILKTRFLFISAVMSDNDSKEFSQWFSNETQNILSSPKIFGKEWEPTRKLIGYFEWNRSHTKGRIKYIDKDNNNLFLQNIIEKRKYKYYFKPTKGTRNREFPSYNYKEKKFHRGDTCVELAYKFVDEGNILIFVPTTTLAKSAANSFLRLFEYKKYTTGETIKKNFEERHSASLEMAKSWLGETHPITECLKYGIGVHHGRLSEPLRNAIEKDFRMKNLEVLIATNTIGQGLNFPIKTLIIHSLDINRQTRERINVRDFWNIAGRAGRANHETEGQIIFLNFNDYDKSIIYKYTNKNNMEFVKSQFFRIIYEYIIKGRLPEYFLDFENEIKNHVEPSLLNILVEESVETPTEEIIKEIMGFSLFNIQLSNKYLNIVNKSITKVGKNFYELDDKNLRNIYSKTGLHLESCLLISKFIKDYFDEIDDILNADDYESLLKFISELFVEIDEMNDENFIEDENIVRLFKFIISWVNGDEIDSLKSIWNDIFENEDNMHKYINDFLSYRYPWGITSFLLILSYHIDEKAEKIYQQFRTFPTNIKNLSSYIKYGLNNPLACIYKNLGINNRLTCMKLSNIYNKEFNIEKFLKWFSNITVDDLKDINLTNYEIQNVLDTSQKFNYDNKPLDFNEEIICDIKGIYYNEEFRKTYEKIEVGDLLELERDFDNEYDINSIKFRYNNEYLGFVPREIAKFIAVEIDLNDMNFEAIVLDKSSTEKFKIKTEIFIK